MSRFFATGDTSSEEDYESNVSSEESGSEAVVNMRGLIDSSSDDDENRVVRSEKDKQFEELEKITKALKKNLVVDDWVNVLANFNAMKTKLGKSVEIIKKHGFPRFYLKSVVDLETACNDLQADKDARADLSSHDSGAWRKVAQDVKKHVDTFAKQIAAYKANPDDEEEVKKPAPKPKAAASRFFGSDSEEEDEDDYVPGNKRLGDSDEDDDDDEFVPRRTTNAFSLDDDEDEEDEDDYPESDADEGPEIDDDIDDISLLSGRITRDFWVKKEKKEEEKPVQRKEKTRRPRESKKTEEAYDEEGQLLTKAQKQKQEMLKARANEEVTPAIMAKRLRDIVASRGKRSADRLAIVNELRFLETKTDGDTSTLLRVQSLLALSLLDMHTRRGALLTLANWRECITHVEAILKTLNDNDDVRLAEDDSFDDSALDEMADEGELDVDGLVDAESSAWLARRSKMLEAAKAKAAQEAAVTVVDPNVTYVEGNLYSFVYKISSEYYKALQSTDHLSAEYVARLKEQPRLINLFKGARNYYQLIKKSRMEARVVQLWLEFEYYYYHPELDVLTGAKEDASSLVDELVTVAYASEDPRSRVRALLFQCYFWCVHNRYDQARERMQMSHIQDAINELDISTRILYNRTLVQLGLAAFRRGEFRSTLNTIADLFSVPQRIKELLAQGVVTKPDSREEDIADAKRRIYPYHMHINMDLIDAAHLISALLVEIPNIAEVGWSRRVISRPFRKHYQYFLQNLVNASQVDTPRDVIMSAAKALYDGDWKKSYDFLLSLKMWSYVRQADAVKAVMLDRIKRESLRSFLLVNGSHYTSISMDVLKNMFSLPEHVIMQITNKMLHTDLLSGAWDDKVTPACIVITTTASNKLQKLSLQFVDRLQQFSEHMNIPSQQRAASRIDDASQNKQKWGERRSTKNFATTRDRRGRN